MVVDNAVIPISYNWNIQIQDAATGRVVRDMYGHNVITTTGKTLIAQLISGGSSSNITHMGVGGDGTAEQSSDTALVDEKSRTALTATTDGTAQTQLQYLLPADTLNGNVLEEAGLFNASSGGTMLNRWTYAAITKSSAIQVLYSVTLSIA